MSALAVFAEHEDIFTTLQSQMLDGLLGDDATSERALQAWSAKVNLDDIDNASYRLIPALFSRSGSSPALQSLHGRMKGIYRYYFYRNNRFLSRMEKIFAELIAADIDFILFKGVSITIQHHGSAAVRSSGDCDIIIRRQDKERAEAILAGREFVYRYNAERKLKDRHSHDFVDSAESGFDLHWHALVECCEENIDDGFWIRSHHVTWRGLRLRVLAPEDELLVAGINGVREIDAPRADWLYDASVIMRSTPNLNWRLVREELLHRNIQHQFIKALGQFARFIPDFPTAAVSREFSKEIQAAARIELSRSSWHTMADGI